MALLLKKAGMGRSQSVLNLDEWKEKEARSRAAVDEHGELLDSAT